MKRISAAGESLQDFDEVRLEQMRRATVVSQGPSVLYDADGVCRAASPAWETAAGWPDGSALGKRYDELLPDLEPEVAAIHRRVFDGNALLNDQEERYVAEDGRVRWIQCEYRPFKSLDARVIGYVVHGRDVTALVAARREAQLNAERLKMALEAARAGVFEIDHEARTFWCSPEFEALVGRSMSFEEATGPNWPMIHPDDLERVRALVKAGPEVATEALETRIRMPDGQVRWIQIQIKLLHRADGALAKLTGLVVDIDARKRQDLAMSWMRREAHEAAERLTLALESAHAGVFETDFKNRTFWCSPELTDILGRTLTWAEAVQPVWPVIHPDDRAAMQASVDASYQTLKIEPHEARVIRPDGQIRWVDLRAVIHLDAAGEMSKCVGVMLDIDARKRQELALIEARQEAQRAADRLRIALDAGQAGVFETDFKNKTFWCSPQFAEIMGRELTFEEASQRSWPMTHPEDAAEVTRRIAESADDRRESVRNFGMVQNRIILPSGDIRWVDTCAELHWAEDGTIEKVVGLVLNIDQRKQQELALVEAQLAAEDAAEAKSQFLANMSHEIRTPMNGVMGVLHLLESEPLSEEGQGLLREAQACGQMLAQLLNDVIDFSKIEAGRMELSSEPLDAARLLQSVAGMLRPQAEAKGLKLSVSAAADGGWISADPVRLRQALFNLIGNAVKFTGEGRVEARLMIRGEAPGVKRLRFEIEDTGVGIAEAAQEHLFQRFHQADGSTARRFGGSGLGLAITRSLAEMMGGTVGFASREGEGSTFWLDFAAPAVQAPADGSERSSRAAAAPLQGLRILVVEDNPTNQLVAGKILEGLGGQVATAADGALGVEAVANDPYDLVLMDVQMPRMDGVEATRRIRALGGPAAATPIIGLTANAMAHQRAAYLEAGMDGITSKPISPADLIAEIVRVLGEASDRPQEDQRRVNA